MESDMLFVFYVLISNSGKKIFTVKKLGESKERFSVIEIDEIGFHNSSFLAHCLNETKACEMARDEVKDKTSYFNFKQLEENPVKSESFARRYNRENHCKDMETILK